MKNKNMYFLIATGIVISLLFGFYSMRNNKSLQEVHEVSLDTSTPISTSTVTTTNSGEVKKTVPNSAPTNSYIRLGQKTLINGIYVTPVKVSYDSRCPQDMQCIQAGSVDLGVLLESGSLSQNLIITSGKTYTFAKKQITLTSVLPARISTKKITEAEYRFLFTVKN